DAIVEGRAFFQGDYVIPLAQPFRPFIKEVMESQEYPIRRYTPGGEIIRPYDITSWSLPLHRGISSVEINTKQQQLNAMLISLAPDDLLPPRKTSTAEFLVFNGNYNESFSAAFRSLTRGIEVYRSSLQIIAEGKELPAGSFLVRVTGRNQQIVDQLLKEMITTPIRLENKPDGFEIISLPRIAIVETWLHDMDAGWARFLFDSYGIPFTVVRPSEIPGLNLSQRFDVLIFADSGRDHLLHGHTRRGEETFIPFYPPGYAEGMKKEGWQNVLEFIYQGGIVLSWARSVDLFTGLMEPKAPQQQFRFPVSNASASLVRQGLDVPGSLLRVNLLPDHPLTLGMQPTIGVFQRTNPILDTSIPAFGMDRRVIAHFPEREILKSGFSENERLLERKPAMVWMRRGKGQVILYSFAPNFRGSTQVANKLIFNALLLNSQ
ncbi:MAG TPA: hypothetical protein VLH61_06335, partial [Bacteroidales bacterium]|nr:hypothetical protein [Bacteroidales bacterium]